MPLDAVFCQPGEISPRRVSKVEGLCCQLLAVLAAESSDLVHCSPGVCLQGNWLTGAARAEYAVWGRSIGAGSVRSENIYSGVIFPWRHARIRYSHLGWYPCVEHLHGVSLLAPRTSRKQDASLRSGCGTPCHSLCCSLCSSLPVFPWAEQGSCRRPWEHPGVGLSHVSLKGVWSDPALSGLHANK